MNAFGKTFELPPITYVARDIERALGMKPSPTYRIVTNRSWYSEQVHAKYPDFILLVDSADPLDTDELLSRKETLSFIGKSHLLVFKNTRRIEQISKENNIPLLNPPATLAQQVEEKLSQVEWLGDLSCHLPPHSIEKLGDVSYSGNPFILQFNHSHTGAGTILINNSKILDQLKEKFPGRPVKKVTYIEGAVYTINVCVNKEQVFLGAISYQITGLSPFTNNPFATIGNDWSFASQKLSQKQKDSITKIATRIGQHMAQSGWKGLFGIDVIVSRKTGDVFLLEINARQAASVSYESQLETKLGVPTIFLTHLRCLNSLPVDRKAEDVRGAQIIIRREFDNETPSQNLLQTLEKLGFTAIPYEKGSAGSDLVRIQSTQQLMKDYNVFSQELMKLLPLLRKKSVLETYSNLPIGGKSVRCPYFNNRKTETRGALRVLIGKGTPEEIIEEAKLFAVREKINLEKLSSGEIRQFLIKHNLGIDCSGYAFHYYSELFKDAGKNFARSISWSHKKSLLRRLISRLRPAENCSVKTLAHPSNSIEISVKDVTPGDFIAITPEPESSIADHIFIITKVQNSTLFFTHAKAWPKDGIDMHGIHHGTIKLSADISSIKDASWQDDSLTPEEFQTYIESVGNHISLRRLKGMAK